jgi:hydroxymethylglutaryl-CoA lyase
MGFAPSLEIVEVGPRDGFQAIHPIIPTNAKVEMIRGLHAAGIRRMEISAFVSKTAVPQLADAEQVLEAAGHLPAMDAQVLVPNEVRAERALAAGARHLSFVVSVSEAHNRSNVRRSPAESVAEYSRIIAALPEKVKVRLNIATAFDCPFLGTVPRDSTLRLLESAVSVKHDVEVALCDTTGRVTPDRVESLFAAARSRFPQVSSWAYHGHDTFGLGLVNVFAAWNAGIHVIDASFAGLGGCPFAPGATGNVATEDVVWAFENMGVRTGVNLEALVELACQGASLPGAVSGGRVRDALRARRGRPNGDAVVHATCPPE